MERARPREIDFDRLPTARPVRIAPDAPTALIEAPEKPTANPYPKRKTHVDPYEVYQLARMGCTLADAAQFFGLKLSRLNHYLDRDDNLRLAWERGAAQKKISLRRLQWAHAERPGAPGVAMTIHMSKHQLDEVEKQEIEHSGANHGPIEVTFSFDSPAAKRLPAGANGSAE
jgi:hypothetical protein